MVGRLSISRKTLIRGLHRKKGRAEEGAYLAEGERLLGELADNSGDVRFVFGTADRIGWLAERFPGIECCEIEGNGAGLFATEQTQGVGAVVNIPAAASLAELVAAGGPVVYLDRIADPGNAGTIIRTAEWFGLDAIAFGEGSVDPYNPKVVRASMGAIFHSTFALDVPARDLMDTGLPLIALDAAAEEHVGSVALPRGAVYVIGSEAHGLSPEIAEHARLLAIGGSGRVESLNAAIAAGILLYELSRA